MTTGSLVRGCVKGLGKELGVSGLNVSNEINFIEGDPNDVLTANAGSDVAYDGVNGQYYMGLAQNGSTWVKLGSIA